MNNNIELKWDELKLSYQPSDFSFATTDELLGSNGIIGQESAQDALKIGLKINAKGYNMYICGECGVGKLSSIISILERQAQHMNTPQDISYVYNFINSEIPRLIILQPGDGKKFKEDMNEFVQFIINELPLKLQSTEANKQRQGIAAELESEKQKLLMELEEKAEAMGILVKQTKDGIGFAPLGEDGDIISKEEYEHLSKKQKELLNEKLSKLYTVADSVAERINAKEKVCLQELEEIDREIFFNEIGWVLKRLKEKYKAYKDITTYLDEVSEDVLDNLHLFENEHETSNKDMKEMFPWLTANGIQKLVKKYGVNLIVDHSQTKGAPIVTDINLENYNLTGKVLLDSELNMLYSDFTNIRAGLFHKANGGYLVLRVQSILENIGSWMAIKKMLKTGYIRIENPEDMNITTVTSIKPEPLKADIKIILLGNYELYHTLSSYDEDFKKLFKIRIDFDDEIESSKEQLNKLAQLVKNLCDEEGLPSVSLEGIIKIGEYGNRVAQNPRKLPANIETLLDLVRESSIFAKDIISAESVCKAIQHRQNFKLKLEKRIDERIIDNLYLIDTEGEKIGQINGLAVYTVDEYMFGRPVKITATTYKGKLGIVDIEKESGLSGDIHTKGIQIITGFLGHSFAQDMPLSLSCNICFEQSYSGIDGDSASSVELYAILSSLSEVPIRQNIAATGSVNQYGQIQPIGGVNEKIEGFFKTCKRRGLKGNEGVIIPIQNKKELMLEEEIVDAVRKNLFHIYAVSTIEEGMQIITGYTYSDIEGRVRKKLAKFNKQPEHL
ncbi:MAG: peptidase lon domain protein [Clostridia bacterium]|jgi:predicted ATP-dependent protease|nr:peptidase lon domain protein [Clostridia bacterium]